MLDPKNLTSTTWQQEGEVWLAYKHVTSNKGGNIFSSVCMQVIILSANMKSFDLILYNTVGVIYWLKPDTKPSHLETVILTNVVCIFSM